MDSRSAETKVLSCILHQEAVLERLRRREAGIKIERFLNPHLRVLVHSTLSYFVLYGDLPPTRKDLVNQVKADNPNLAIPDIETLDELLDEVYEDTDPGHFDFYRDRLNDNWMSRKAREGVAGALEPLEKNDFKNFSESLMGIIRDLSVDDETVIRVDPFNRDYDRELDELRRLRTAGPSDGQFIPTGLPWLDEHLDGGFLRGENYLAFGYTGRGKSFLGTQFGYAAAQAGFKTVKFSLEMRARKDLARFKARLSRIPVNLFLRRPWLITDEQMEGFETLSRQWKEQGKVYEVRSWDIQPTMTALRSELAALAYDPDLVIVDQITDLAISLDWKEIAAVASQLQLLAKGWANERGVATVTFGQARRGTLNESHLTMEDFAYGRAPTEWCTAVIYLAQTKDDEEEKVIRLGICKDRDGESTRDQMTLRPAFDVGRIHCFERDALETADENVDIPGF